jgi:hypothetical protein
MTQEELAVLQLKGLLHDQTPERQAAVKDAYARIKAIKEEGEAAAFAVLLLSAEIVAED